MKLRKSITSVISMALISAVTLSMTACGAANGGTEGTAETAPSVDTTASASNKEPIVMVWYPNESAEDFAPAREEFGKLIEQATGRKVEQKLTTDYAIAIEAIANGTASICFMGAQGYVEAKNKSDDVQPLFVNSGASGTLDDAIYYSFLAVNDEEKAQYQNGADYSIDPIQGKRMSFVSNSSTSGFKVPTSDIIEHFSTQPQWSKLDADMLIEGGKDMFFSEVLFGGSHQGSAVNLLTHKADVAAFCDTEIDPYADLIEGEVGQVGSVYQIREGASAPFDKYAGHKLAVIESVPVLNGPFAYNSKTLTADEVEKIQSLFTSDETAQNPVLFVPEGSGNAGMFSKTAQERFVTVEDAWYNPVRDLSK